MNNLRRLLKNKKGFTLVEVIVVLVIIAILAAITLPALTGYIDEANQKAAIAEGRTVYAALQTMASVQYGTGEEYFKDLSSDVELDTGGVTKFNALTGLTATPTNIEIGPNHEITGFEFKSGDYTVKFKRGGSPEFSAEK